MAQPIHIIEQGLFKQKLKNNCVICVLGKIYFFFFIKMSQNIICKVFNIFPGP